MSDGDLRPPGKLFVPGIFNDPWPLRAQEWCKENHIDSDSSDYLGGFLANWFVGQRIRGLVTKVEAAAMRYQLDAYAHSHGCKRLPLAIERAQVALRDLHLIAGACSDDFDTNRLNALLYKKLAQRVYVYAAFNDHVLSSSRYRNFLASSLGFGRLGHHGPRNVLPGAESRVILVRVDYMGHGTWLARNNLHAILDGSMAHQHGVTWRKELEAKLE